MVVLCSQGYSYVTVGNNKVKQSFKRWLGILISVIFLVRQNRE